jgi:hypothetical protein
MPDSTLDILIRTIADLNGAKATQEALDNINRSKGPMAAGATEAQIKLEADAIGAQALANEEARVAAQSAAFAAKALAVSLAAVAAAYKITSDSIREYAEKQVQVTRLDQALAEWFAHGPIP